MGSENNDLFVIQNRILKSFAVFDYETDSVLSIRLRTDDGNGGVFEKTFDISVTDVVENGGGTNFPPSNILLSSNSIDENANIGTVVGILSAVDANGTDIHQYTLVAGLGDADNEKFAIQGNELKTFEVLDYETDSLLNIRIKVDDQNGGLLTLPLEISVKDIAEVVPDTNSAPTDVILSSLTIIENQPIGTPMGNLSAADSDAEDVHLFSLSQDSTTDNAAFTIQGNQLKSFKVFDYESDSIYEIRIRVDDQRGGVLEKDFVIKIINSTDPIPNSVPTDIVLSNFKIAENQNIGTTVGTLNGIDENGSDTLIYSFVSGSGDTDNDNFVIQGNLLKTFRVFDYESDSIYSVRIKVDDKKGGAFEKSFEINITDLVENIGDNQAPTDIQLTNDSIAENANIGVVVGRFSTVDPNGSDIHSYSFVEGFGSDDNLSFVIQGDTLRTFKVFDFESDSILSIRVKTDDGRGGLFEKALLIRVRNEVEIINTNLAPTDIVVSNLTIPEDLVISSTVGTLSSADPNGGDTHTYSLVSGSGDDDNASFVIQGDQIKTFVTFDYETDSTYTIRIKTEDQDGLFFEKNFDIKISNVVEKVNSSPTDLQLSNQTITENSNIGTVIGSLSSVDLDGADVHSYELVPGAGSEDNDLFVIQNGQLKSFAVFDYETDSVASVRIRTNDGFGGVFEKAIQIKIVDVVENVGENFPPTHIILSSSTIKENQSIGTVIGQLSATDANGSDSHQYTLVSGDGDIDNNKFAIQGSELKSFMVFDYESDSLLQIRVRVDDQRGGVLELPFDIKIENVIEVIDSNDVPTDILLSNDSFPENGSAGAVLATLTSLDPNGGDVHTYRLVNGVGDTDNELFAIKGNRLQSFVVFDFESKSSYSIRVETADQDGATFSKSFVLVVTDVNEGQNSNSAPTDIVLSNITIKENQSFDAIIGNLSSIDENGGDIHTYSFASGAGDDDNPSFVIQGNVLRAFAIFDYESDSIYSVRIKTDDGQGGVFFKVFEIKVLNEVEQVNTNKPPTDVLLSNSVIEENQAIGTIVGQLITVDEDPLDLHAYSFVAGDGDDDNSSFVIQEGALKTFRVFDFESDSIHSIRLRSEDSTGAFTDKVLEILVLDLVEDTAQNFVPNDILISNSAINENSDIGTVIGNLTTIDANGGDVHLYNLVAGAGDENNPDFVLQGNQLKTFKVFDYEFDSTYSVRIRTDDQRGGVFEKSVTIMVNDVFEDTSVNTSPTDILLSNHLIDEENAINDIVGKLSSVDANGEDEFVYSLVSGGGDADNSLFFINSNELRANAIFDFESDSLYSIRVRTTDQAGGAFEKPFEIKIRNTVEDTTRPVPPEDVFLSKNDIDENLSIGSLIGTLSAKDANLSDTLTYSFTSGSGDDDNNLFVIQGDQLLSFKEFDFEVKSSYSIRVKVTDNDGLSTEKSFDITINDVSEQVTFIPEKSSELIVYPNPTDGALNVVIGNIKWHKLTVYHLNGIQAVDIKNTGSLGIISLDLDFLPSGVYLLSVYGREVKRQMIQIR